MCGICGRFNYSNAKPINKSEILNMMNSISHRGPDDSGNYLDREIGMGFRRLSIIDLESGHQPMIDNNRRAIITFNGEIYNYRDIRKRLIGNGYVFRTSSDTEVILNAYLHFGDDFLNELNGMFGLAIWDLEKRRLILARDRSGIKSLYYTLDEHGIIYGSEMRTLMSSDVVIPDLDIKSIGYFLRFRYTPSPHTLLKGFMKLEPGHCIVIEDSQMSIRKWWTGKPINKHATLRYREAYNVLDEIYSQAVKRHLISDVPVGLLLSGGVDSALLLSYMNNYGHNWKTFTVGYGEVFQDDEMADARRSSGLLGSDHYEYHMDQDSFENNLSMVIHALEEPVTTSSIVPMFNICRMARSEVKVALVGQGPDELFGGYKRHLGLMIGTHWRRVPSVVRHLIKKELTSRNMSEQVERALFSLDVSDRMHRYENVLSLSEFSNTEKLFSMKLQGNILEDDHHHLFDRFAEDIDLADELAGFQAIELRSTLPDELLMYSDKLSMASGLELRVPYLDREILEYVENLPTNLKISWFRRKFLHKQIALKKLPHEIVHRKKRAFASNVVDDWFRGSMQGKMLDYLSSTDSRIYEYLSYDYVSELVNHHRKGIRDYHKILFSIVALEEWLRSYYYYDWKLNRQG